MTAPSRAKYYRWALLFIGGAIGTALLAVHLWYYCDDLDRDSFKRDIIFLQGSILLIMATYNTCHYGSRMLGLNSMAAEAQRTKKWHGLVLNALLIMFYLAGFIYE